MHFWIEKMIAQWTKSAIHLLLHCEMNTWKVWNWKFIYFHFLRPLLSLDASYLCITAVIKNVHVNCRSVDCTSEHKFVTNFTHQFDNIIYEFLQCLFVCIYNVHCTYNRSQNAKKKRKNAEWINGMNRLQLQATGSIVNVHSNLLYWIFNAFKTTANQQNKRCERPSSWLLSSSL